MDLRTKYAQAIQVAKSVQLDGSAQEQNGKLHVVGTVKSEDAKNRIWNALRTVAEWKNEVVANIRVVSPVGASAPTASPASRTYTVQAGDTLSKIAQTLLGQTGDYTRIFEANRDQLSHPDKVTPGQVLRIPA